MLEKLFLEVFPIPFKQYQNTLVCGTSRCFTKKFFTQTHFLPLSLSLSWVYHDNNHCQNHCLQESDRLFIFGNFDCRGKKFTQNRATQMLEHRLKYQVVPIFDLVVSAANLTSRMNYSVL